MKKIISIILVAVIAIGAYKYFSENSQFLMTTGSDEERIEDTLSKFSESYNNGDFDSLVKCHTKRMQSDLKAQMGLGSSLFSGAVSFFSSGLFNFGDSGLESLWALGTNGCQIDLEIIDIDFTSETKAEVKLNYIELDNNNRKTKAFLSMEKENNAWCVASDFYEHSKRN